jgi:hypothetical protein
MVRAGWDWTDEFDPVPYRAWARPPTDGDARLETAAEILEPAADGQATDRR